MNKLVFILGIALAISCNKALDSKWNIDIVIPLVHGELNFSDLVPDSITQINSDQSVSLHLESNALKFELDTLGSIQELSTIEKFQAPFVSFDFDPGATFPTPIDETSLDFGDASLKELRIKSGKLGLSVKSYIEEKLVANFTILSAEQNGISFQTEEIIPEGAGDSPGEFYEEYDISGYELDLTGENGSLFNTILSSLNVIIDPNGSTVTVLNSDTLIIEVFYIDINTQYARGFFGSREISQVEETIDFSLLENIAPNSIDFNQTELKLDLINGVGADFRFRLDELASLNSNHNSEVLLDHELIGKTINVNRAEDNQGLVPYESGYILNNANSNIDEWIENFPNNIEYSIFAELNPLGNVSGGNDFIYCESELGFNISVDIPLCFSVSDLVLSDTLALDLNEDENIDNIRSGNIELQVSNSFPLEGEIQLYLLENNLITDSLISSNNLAGSVLGSFNPNISASSVLTVPIDDVKFEKLKNADQLILNATLSSPDAQEVKILAEQRIDVTAVLKANYLVDTE